MTITALVEREVFVERVSVEDLLLCIEKGSSPLDNINCFFDVEHLLGLTQNVDELANPQQSVYTIFQQFHPLSKLMVRLGFVKALGEATVQDEVFILRRGCAVKNVIDEFLKLLTSGTKARLSHSLKPEAQHYLFKLIGGLYNLFLENKTLRMQLDMAMYGPLGAYLENFNMPYELDNLLKKNLILFISQSNLSNKQQLLRGSIKAQKDYIESLDESEKEIKLKSLISQWQNTASILRIKDLEWLKAQLDMLPGSRISIRQRISEKSHNIFNINPNTVSESKVLLIYTLIAFGLVLNFFRQSAITKMEKNDQNERAMNISGIVAIAYLLIPVVVFDLSRKKNSLFYNPANRLTFPKWAADLQEKLKPVEARCSIM